jgi:uncharacterized protein YjcR
VEVFERAARVSAFKAEKLMRTDELAGFKYRPELWLEASQIKSWFSKRSALRKEIGLDNLHIIDAERKSEKLQKEDCKREKDKEKKEKAEKKKTTKKNAKQDKGGAAPDEMKVWLTCAPS